MLKFLNTEVVFQEVPNETTLAINITNCPCHCDGCHSDYLAGDIGTELWEDNLSELIENHRGITCVCFMGGDKEPNTVNYLAAYIRGAYPKIKTAWYSGRDSLSDKIELANFDYIKLGRYDKELGGLKSNTTNQRLYRIQSNDDGEYSQMVDITNTFWK